MRTPPEPVLHGKPISTWVRLFAMDEYMDEDLCWFIFRSLGDADHTRRVVAKFVLIKRWTRDVNEFLRRNSSEA